MEEQEHEKWTIDVVASPEGPSNRLSRRDVLGMSCAAVALFIIQGCGGGGGGGSNGSGIPTDGDFFRATNVSVKDEVVLMPDDGSVTVSNLTPTGLTLSGIVPTILVGSVIVSGIGAGIMRKVTSVTTNGADTVLQTEDASLEQVFNSANVEFRKELKAEHVQEIQTHLDGVEAGGAVAGVGRSRAATAFPVFIPKTFVGEQEGENKTGVEIEANGTIGVAMTGSIDITVANGVERLSVLAGFSWTGTYKFALIGETEFFKKEIPYATFIFNPVPIGAIGPVPVVLLPILHLQLAATGSVSGGWETSGNGTASFAMGFRYDQLPLGSDFSTSNITPLGSRSHTGNFVASNFFATLKFEAAGWQPELVTSFNGVIGPTFKGDIPAVGAELKANSTNNSVEFTSDAIFRARVGAEAGVLGFSWPLWETTVAEHKIPIKYKTWQPGDGSVGIS